VLPGYHKGFTRVLQRCYTSIIVLCDTVPVLYNAFLVLYYVCKQVPCQTITLVKAKNVTSRLHSVTRARQHDSTAAQMLHRGGTLPNGPSPRTYYATMLCYTMLYYAAQRRYPAKRAISSYTLCDNMLLNTMLYYAAQRRYPAKRAISSSPYLMQAMRTRNSMYS
jgi:hypothetical protein